MGFYNAESLEEEQDGEGEEGGEPRDENGAAGVRMGVDNVDNGGVDGKKEDDDAEPEGERV